MERAAEGDREAFDVIMSSVVDRLFAIARLILRDADRAEDAVQETLVACWRDLPSLRDPDRFDAWLRRLLINHVNDEFKRGRRQAATIAVLRIEPSQSDASGDVATRDLLQRGFQRLSLDHRTVIVLRFYLGLSIEETATTLGIQPDRQVPAPLRDRSHAPRTRGGRRADGQGGQRMNAGPDVERLLSDWLVEEAPAGAPDRMVLAATNRIDHTMQRRFGAARRPLPMNPPVRVAAAAVIGVLLLGGAYTSSVAEGVPTSAPRPHPARVRQRARSSDTAVDAGARRPGLARTPAEEPAGGAPVAFVVPRGARVGDGVVRPDPQGDSSPDPSRLLTSSTSGSVRVAGCP